MKRGIIALAFLLPFLAFSQQASFFLKSQMDGTFVMDNGSTTNFWGYGYAGNNPITLPSPLLEVMQGDSVHIEFTNLSPEAHTIHMHGLDANQVNDGVPQTSFYVFINQTGEYNFIANHPGTFLYHCHVTTTLHLTMGMYGMLVVKYPGDLLYENGPGYNQEFQHLVSDLEVEVNDLPSNAFPFHEIYPDYFMVNGKSGTQLSDNLDEQINAHIGDSIVLRLGSMAYSKVRYIFPQGSNPMTYMSDGRILSEALDIDTLEMYPGERFSVILNPDETLNGNIEVQYFSMVNKSYLGSNYITVNNLGDPENITDLKLNSATFSIHPNPASKSTQITIYDDNVDLLWYTMDGKLVKQQNYSEGVHDIDLSSLSKGVYLLKDEAGYYSKLVVQ